MEIGTKSTNIRIDVIYFLDDISRWVGSQNIILHPVKGLSGNVEAPRNALRLSIEYVFILIEKIQWTKELVNDEPFD